MQDGPRSGGQGLVKSCCVSPSGRPIGDKAQTGSTARKPAGNRAELGAEDSRGMDAGQEGKPGGEWMLARRGEQVRKR